MPARPGPALELLQPLLFALKAFCGAHLFANYVGYPQQCAGPSMLPELNVAGDFVWISTRHRRGRGVRPGDVVSARHPVEPEAGMSKRVVGLGGDFVLRDGGVGGSDLMVQVPEGHCWLVGDNLPWSRDSRDYGPQPLAMIRGKVVARIWPLHQCKWIRNGMHEVPE